jgi:hypothetical protein
MRTPNHPAMIVVGKKIRVQNAIAEWAMMDSAHTSCRMRRIADDT